MSDDDLNEGRADWGEMAVLAFAQQSCRGIVTDMLRDAPDVVLRDLLAALHHYADRHGLFWREIADEAEQDYACDIDPEEIGGAPKAALVRVPR
jgi:hypothetical protein